MGGVKSEDTNTGIIITGNIYSPVFPRPETAALAAADHGDFCPSRQRNMHISDVFTTMEKFIKKIFMSSRWWRRWDLCYSVAGVGAAECGNRPKAEQ